MKGKTMTQIERILDEGIISEDFLKEEDIGGFKVTRELKELQAIEFDLLVKFDEVCRKHKLTYFLIAGTLLGAVRHKGFIPWDDDVDVIMPRADYEKFNLLSSEFNAPYFLQTPETDKGYLYSITKIKNSETSGVNPLRAGFGFNFGLWIDVFPLDKCVLEDREAIWKEIDMLNSFNSAYMKIPQKEINKKGIDLLRNHTDLSPQQALNRITELAKKHINDDTEYVSEYTTTVYNWKKLVWKAVDFSETIQMPFCTRSFPVPVGFDNVLRVLYGNYMELPQIEDLKTNHSGNIFDANRSYRDVYKELGIELNYEN
jgi:lipopolysaccharide cholinephosphotransferase